MTEDFEFFSTDFNNWNYKEMIKINKTGIDIDNNKNKIGFFWL
jgi:hypothetical protein